MESIPRAAGPEGVMEERQASAKPKPFDPRPASQPGLGLRNGYPALLLPDVLTGP
jgi:hypothetical protein